MGGRVGRGRDLWRLRSKGLADEGLCIEVHVLMAFLDKDGRFVGVVVYCICMLAWVDYC